MRYIAATLSLILTFTFAIPATVQAQHQVAPPAKALPPVAVVKPEPAESSNVKFRRSLLSAANKSAKAGKIKRRQVLALRINTLSPAFLDAAKQVCVAQMYFSAADEKYVPVTSDGHVDVDGIDWDALADFLERIVPIILQLIEIFSQASSSVTFNCLPNYMADILHC
jgi:hypothetical protein